MKLLIRIIVAAVSTFVLFIFLMKITPAFAYKLMNSNWVILVPLAIFIALCTPGKNFGVAFLVGVALLALIYMGYDKLNNAMNKVEQKLTLGLTPEQAKDRAERTDLWAASEKNALDLIQQRWNSCLRDLAGSDAALAPKMKVCTDKGLAFQKTKGFEDCLNTNVFNGSLSEQVVLSKAVCYGPHQSDLDAFWKGFVVALDCKVPTIPNCEI